MNSRSEVSAPSQEPIRRLANPQKSGMQQIHATPPLASSAVHHKLNLQPLSILTPTSPTHSLIVTPVVPNYALMIVECSSPTIGAMHVLCRIGVHKHGVIDHVVDAHGIQASLREKILTTLVLPPDAIPSLSYPHLNS